MATYNVHAGHNFKVPGAGGCFSETSEARNVKNLVISKLRSLGHTVYDCTDEDGATSSQNLVNIVSKCNQHAVDLDISIHFNAFNGQAHGVEVLNYNSKTADVCNAVLNKIVALGFTNRGLKDGSWLYVLKNTNARSFLIECCFCDNAGDAKIYTAEKMATAIVEGLTGVKVGGSTAPTQQVATNVQLYRVRKSWADAKSQLGAYKDINNAKAQCPDGYSVFDGNGAVVFSNTSQVQSNQLYRIRKTWADVKSQIGAYRELENAKKECVAGYSVFDWNGNAVYSVPVQKATSNDEIYRVRKSWDDAKSQIGAYKILDNAKVECNKAGAGYSVFDWSGNAVYSAPVQQVNTAPAQPEAPAPEEKPEPKPEQATFNDISPLKGISHEAFIAYVGQIAKKDMQESGVLASVTIAQAILESAWGQSELSLKANNLFGMKSSLSGNTWKSEWDGKIYAKVSPEDDGNGNISQVRSDFRLYSSPEASIKDHNDYLCGAKNRNTLRYGSLPGVTDYRKAAQIIKDGGYATDSGYVDKLCSIIKTYNLDVYDCKEPAENMDEKKELQDIKNEIAEVKGILNLILTIVQKIASIFSFKK